MIFLKKKEISLTEIFNNKFVDIHSHLLPGIDDGAKNIDNSIELIKKMNSFGIKNFITTPHVMGDIYENSTETILKKLDEVRSALHDKGHLDISINASAEYMLDHNFMKLLQKDDILPLKDKYILVEMSFMAAPVNLYDQLFEIQLKNYKPILAHPERYAFYHLDFNNYYQLKKAGCLFQLNLLSLTNHYGVGVQKTAYKLLEMDMYDVVGTDTHHKHHLELLKKIGTKKNKAALENLISKNAFFGI